MTGRYLLAIDAGTGSVRAVLFDFDGNQIGVAQREWEHKTDPRFPGSMDFDWVHNWDLASTCVREVLADTGVDPKDIAAISTTCMREGILLYDEDGNEIWACANVDSRANDEVANLVQQDPTLERELYKKSGEAYAIGDIPRILWVKNKLPEVYEKTRTVGMFNDWLIYKLTGVLAIEPSNASTTGLLNLKTRDWDPEIARVTGIKEDIFPEMYECGTKVACVNEKGSKDTGLAVGTPVVVGGGDCQLGSIGVGIVRSGQGVVFGGSFWQYEFTTDNGETDPNCRIRVNCHALPNLWQYEALAFNPGLVMRWYRDAFCDKEKELAAANGGDPYDYMNEEAAKIPAGSYGMICAFSDVMNFMSWKHASPTFTNFDINPDKFNKYTFYRAILENTALVTYGHLKLVEEATGHMPEEIIFAGGASKSPLWCQILADVLGLPVKVPVVREATALGAAMLAGIGIGVYKDAEEAASRCVKFDKTYIPNDDNHRLYRDMYPIWEEVYKAQLELSDRKLTRNMWIAPGL